MEAIKEEVMGVIGLPPRKRYVDGVEQAKLVRAALKAAFPGVKFSVRKDGNAINIGWTDGPTAKAVDEVKAPFVGGGFDAMQDIAYSVTQELDGETVQYHCDYVFTQREVSDEWRAEVMAKIGAVTGVEYPTDWKSINGYERIPVRVDYHTGELLHMATVADGEYLQDVYYRYVSANVREA